MKYLMTSTQISYQLALTATVRNSEGEEYLTTKTLIQLTTLVMFIWQVQITINHYWSKLLTWIDELIMTVELTFKVVSIGLSALAFGLGVKL